MRDGEAADDACGGHAAVNSCGGEVNGGAGKAGPVGSERRKVGQRWGSCRHFDPDITPVIRVMEEGEQPCREEFSPESPATEGMVEQGETLHVIDGVWQKHVEDAVTQHTWLLVNPFSLQVELMEEVHAGVSGGHLGRRKTLCRLCRRLCWIGTGQGVEWCCKLYHVGVVEKESERGTTAAVRWYQFGAPWEKIVVDIAVPLPCKPLGWHCLSAATGRPPVGDLA